jgi:hypothetical protein
VPDHHPRPVQHRDRGGPDPQWLRSAMNRSDSARSRPRSTGLRQAPGCRTSVPGRVMWPMTVGVQRQGDQRPGTGHITVRVMTAS